MELLPHIVWAFVALCGLGVYAAHTFGVWRRIYLDARHKELAQTFKMFQLESAALHEDVKFIRGELEKLKAIPPKQPRF